MLNKDRKKAKEMKTSDLERELGLSKYTLRYYEKEGLITPQRDNNGYRCYSDEDLQTLKLVKFLRSLNISIDDVKAIIHGKLDFHECLKMNQIHLDHQIESLKEVKKTIDNYHDKDLPLIPALQDIQETTHHWTLGIQKTTNAVSLGRKLTKAWAKRQMIYNMVIGALMAFLISMVFIAMVDSVGLRFLIYMMIYVLVELVIIAFSYKMTSSAMIDLSLNQSVEFIESGIRYYQFKNPIKNIQYFFAVLRGKDKQYMKYYRYEDIRKVSLYVKKRYMKIASPIAYENDVIDFEFEFCDGQKFYFYYPMILDDDARYIGAILEAKVSCIEDKDNVLYAMKSGLNITDYMMSKNNSEDKGYENK